MTARQLPVVYAGPRLLIEDAGVDFADPHQERAPWTMLPQRVVRQVVIHSTDPDATAWHLLAESKGRGWPHVGRHYLIERAPEARAGKLVVQQLLSPQTMGLGTPPNYGRLHVVCAGQVPTGPQREALLWLLRYLCQKYPIRAQHITPHRELESGVRCPGEAIARMVHWLQDAPSRLY